MSYLLTYHRTDAILSSSVTLIVFLLALNMSFGQDQARAVYLIQQGYTDLIKNLADINADIRSNSDRQITAELKFAKKELINDFIEGPYRIFESKSNIQSNGQNQRIDHYLNSMTHHQVDRVSVTISEVTHENGELRVSFIQRGLQSSRQELMASFVNHGDELLISQLTSVGTNVVLYRTQSSTDIDDQDQIVIPVIEVNVSSKTEEQIIVSGSILNPVEQGTLSIEKSGQEPYEILLNKDHSFTTDLSTQGNRSLNIKLVYQYGVKFIQLHKNIVSVAGQTIFSVPAQVSVMDNPEETGDHE